MANAVASAPEKKEVKIVTIWEGDIKEEVIEGSKEHLALSQEFDPQKKYMFQLAQKNPEREFPVIDMRTKRPAAKQDFPPYRNIVLTSQVTWKGQRRMLRYYDGCSTIFSDKQPKEKEVIDTLIKQSQPRRFIDGKFGTYGEDRLLLLYLNICSWNGESQFRTRTADSVFIPVNADVLADEKSARLDKVEEALKLSKEATKTKMLIHGGYLGISDTDWDSGNEISEKEFRALYREKAIQDPSYFVETYGNRSIEIKYFIEKAWAEGTINNKLNANKASWKSGKEICDISGLKSADAIGQKLYEFAKSEEGEEFLLQLRALYEKGNE